MAFRNDDVQRDDDDEKELSKEDYARKRSQKQRKHKELGESSGEKPIKLIKSKPARSRIVYDPNDDFDEWADYSS